MDVSVYVPVDKLSLRSFIRDNLDPNVQQSFSLEAYINVVDRQGSKYPVHGTEAFEWLGYDKKQNLKRLYTKHLDEGVDYVVNMVPSTGGRPSEEVSFTSEAFKNLCMLASTEKGKMVRRYYIALEDLMERYVGMQQAQFIQNMSSELALTKTLLIEANASSADTAIQATHLALMETYAHTPVVYLAFMEQLTKPYYVLKVGSTDDIVTRGRDLNSNFGNAQFMYVMAVRRNRKFETFVQEHTLLKELKYREPINGLNRSIETFTVTDELYKQLKTMMKRQVHNFNCLNDEEEMKMRQMMVDEKQAEAKMKEIDLKRDQFDFFKSHLEELKAKMAFHKERLISCPKDTESKTEYDSLHLDYEKAHAYCAENYPEVVDTMDSPEPSLTTLQQRAETIRIAHNKPRNVARGEFVQRYDPDTLELVDHFVGPTEAIRQFENGCPQVLMKAVKERLIYKGFRWATVARDGDPTKPQDIGETVESRQGGGGMVAVYSHDETRIEHVFPDQLQTKDHLKVKSAATICQAIKSNLKRKCAGVYVQMWADVPDPLKAKYLESKELPKPAERKGGIPVLRIDMHTGQVLERHNNVASVAKDYRMSHMTVKQACETGETHAGFRWRFEGQDPR